MDKKIKSVLIGSIRKAFLYSKMRRDTLADAQHPKIKDKFKCAKCKKYFTRKKVSVDHIKPVVDPKEGFPTVQYLAEDTKDKVLSPDVEYLDWAKYIYRMFCGEKNLQVLCRATCHKRKTKLERGRRKK